jgi:hypothetical protein
MAKDPGFGKKTKVEVIGLKGQCNVGRQIGGTFDISCYNA